MPRVPGITIATDIICGFPTETEDNFEETLSLCERHKFPSLYINQFFPRPGTPAALMPLIPTHQVKKRTKRLTELFYSYEPYGHKLGDEYDVLVSEISFDKKHYVGHNKFYEQILLPVNEIYMGKIVKVKIVKTSKFSMVGQPLNKIIVPGFVKPFKQEQTSGISVREGDCTFYCMIIFTLIAILIRIVWLLF